VTGSGAGSRHGNQSNAAASSVALMGAIVTTLASFGTAYLVSRSGSGFAGAFFVSTAVATIAGNSLTLGTPTGLVYFMAKAAKEGASGPLPLITQALKPVALFAVAAGALLFMAAPSFAGWVSADRVAEITTMIRWFSPAVPAWAITASLLGATRGLGSMTPTVVVGQILRPGGQLLLIGLLFARGEPAAWQVGLAWALPVLATLVVAVFFLSRLGGLERSGPSSVPSAEFWAYTRSRAVSTSLSIALERVDVIFVSALIGSEASGVYGALTRYIAAGNFLIFAVAQAASVNLRRALATENFVRAGAVLRQTTSWLILMAWPYFLALAFKPEPLANLLNSEFVADAGILTILAVGMMVSAAAGPIDVTLLMLGKSRLSLVGIAAAITTDIALLFVLAPRYGLVGAAVAWALSVAVQNALATFFVYRTAKLHVIGRAWVVAALATLAAVVPVAFLAPNQILGLVIIALVGGGILGATVWRLRSLFGFGQTLLVGANQPPDHIGEGGL